MGAPLVPKINYKMQNVIPPCHCILTVAKIAQSLKAAQSVTTKMLYNKLNILLVYLALSLFGLCMLVTYISRDQDTQMLKNRHPPYYTGKDTSHNDEDFIGETNRADEDFSEETNGGTNDYIEDTTGNGERIKRKPNFIVIGVDRCGSESLLSILDLHSKIRRPESGQVSYFDNYKKYDEEWYIEQMGATYEDEMSYENSPHYFMNKKIPERIFNFDSKMKLVLAICDPIKRYVQGLVKSNPFQFMEKQNKEIMARMLLKHDQSWQEWFKERFGLGQKEAEVPTEQHSSHNLLDHQKITIYNQDIQAGMYASNLQFWLEWFAKEQILIVNMNKVFSEPSEELQKVEEFLELEQELGNDRFFFDEGQQVYCYSFEDEQTNCLPFDSTPEIPSDLEKKLKNMYRKPNKLIKEISGAEDLEWIGEW